MKNLIGISGKMGSGKDTVGKILQYLDYEKNVMGGRTKYGIDNFPIEISNYQIKKFAEKLKDMVCILLGCTREQLEDREFKEKELGEEWWRYKIHDGSVFRWATLEKYNEEDKYQKFIVKLTPRKLLQLLGTDCGRDIIHPKIWVNALFADYKSPCHVAGTQKPCSCMGQMCGEPINWIITDVRFPDEVKAIEDRGGIVIRVNRDIIPTLENCKQNLVEVKSTFLDGAVKTKEDFDSRPWEPYEYTEGDDPYLKRALNGRNAENGICGIRLIPSSHPSETALDNHDFNYVIENNGSIEELVETVKQLYGG